jgi:hypothetical protein
MTGCTSQRKDKLESQKESEISFSTPNVSTRLEFILCKGSLLDYHEFFKIICSEVLNKICVVYDHFVVKIRVDGPFVASFVTISCF